MDMKNGKKKILLFITASFCLMLGCCSFFSRNEVVQNGSCDTIVCSKKILNDSNFPFDETEYFVVIGQDTSAYSCIIISENNKWGRADLEFALNEKYYFYRNYSNENDTTVCEPAGRRRVSAKKFRIPCYKDMLNEIDLCFASVSKKLDMRTLRSFSTFLSHLGDVAAMTTNNLNAHFSVADGEIYKHSNIAKALEMTSFRNDMNGILRKYGLEVDNIETQECVYLISKDHFMKTHNISEKQNVPDSIMDVEVYIGLRKATCR